MQVTKTANLILIPTPGMGHLVPAVELAKHLVARDPRLSITTLVIKLPLPDHQIDTHLLSLKSSTSLINQGITFLDLPLLHHQHFAASTMEGYISLYMDAQKPHVKRAVEELGVSGSAPVAGFLVDMFCSAMVDVATELGSPSYVFFPSNASFLSMMFHLQETDHDGRRPDSATEIPGFGNPVPANVWPGIFLREDGATADFLRHAQTFRRAKGILVNTFSELEVDSLRSMSENKRIPPIFPVGPILNLNPPENQDDEQQDATFKWLDEQPAGTVAFLCFGSRGSFGEAQVREIAAGLERSGRRFLWSLRRPPSNENGMLPPSDFDDFGGVLPEGFLERTAGRGRVIGWAPQTAVLAHGAVGAFVTHCGWNSTLESLWFGVPMAAWPIYAEQQLNAFLLVREMGLAAEIKMDYRQDMGEETVVGAAQVAEGIRGVMDEEDEGVRTIRSRVKKMSEKVRKVKSENGSSYESLGLFVEDVFNNVG